MRIRESIDTSHAQIDASNGVIRGVKILGAVSKNGRRYTEQAMAEAVSLYEGIDVNIDHPPQDEGSRERGLLDGFGILRGVHVREGGLWGDLHYLHSHPHHDIIMERVHRFGEGFGLSHNAEGETHDENGEQVVDKITYVYSVDLVRNPATVSTLFESKVKTMKKTIRAILEAVFPSHEETLVEMDEMIPDTELEMPAEADTDSQMKDAFRAMIMAAVDDEALDIQATIAKIRDILKAQEKLMGNNATEASEETDEQGVGDEDEEKIEEATTTAEPDPQHALQEQIDKLQREMDFLKLLESRGLRLTDIPADRQELLEQAETMEACTKLLDSWSDLQPLGTVRSGGRQGQANQTSFPATREDFLNALR